MVELEDEEEDEPERVKRLVNVDREIWVKFQRKHGKGRVSARVRELVREDVERG